MVDNRTKQKKSLNASLKYNPKRTEDIPKSIPFRLSNTDQRIENDLKENSNINFISKILRFGLNKSQSHLERKRIKLVNFIASLILLLQPLFLIIGSMHDSGFIVNLFFMALCGVVLIFQKIKYFNCARWFLIIGTALVYSIINVVYGNMVPADSGYILCIALVLILFTDIKTKVLGFIALSILYVAPSYLLSDFQNMLQEDLPLIAYYLQLFILTFNLFLILNFFLSDLVHYEKHTDTLLLSLQESNSDLIMKQAIIKNKNKDLERFAYIASHDLKAPVRLIGSFVQLIEREVKPYKNQKLEEYLQFAKDGTDQINVLIEDILELSKLDRINTEEYKWVDLNLVLEKIKLEVSTDSNSKESTIKHEKLPTILAKPSHMYSLFFNIIGNGLKYNKSEIPKIKIKHHVKGKYHFFYFQDNGIGIEEKYFEKIFDMFTRLQTSSDFKGTGIGLAITRKIANLYNGNLKVISSDENGTKFQLAIPIDEKEEFIQKNITIANGVLNS